MRYRLQRHDGTDCSATMVPITVLRMVPIQRYRHTSLPLPPVELFSFQSEEDSEHAVKIPNTKTATK